MNIGGRTGSFFRVLRGVSKSVPPALVVLLTGLAVNTFAHVQAHFCIASFSHFERKDMRRVVYGYPMAETLDRAHRGEILLGGCVPGWSTAVCPFCSCTAEFRGHGRKDG